MGSERETDPQCFVCGRENPCGLRLTFTAANGKAAAEFSPSDTHQGYRNLVHGGILSSILDEAMIQAALAEGVAPVTAELTVRFKQPLPVGERAVVEAEIVLRGPRLLKAAAVIRRAGDGAVIAEAQAKLLL